MGGYQEADHVYRHAEEEDAAGRTSERLRYKGEMDESLAELFLESMRKSSMVHGRS